MNGPRLLYFGCHRTAGHFFWEPGMRYSRDGEEIIPWRRVDPVLCPGAEKDGISYGRRRVENEGEANLHHKNGWTALSFWDRTVDTRGGCNSQFFAEGVFTFEEMVALAQEQFPEVWSRFRFGVRLAAVASVEKAR